MQKQLGLVCLRLAHASPSRTTAAHQQQPSCFHDCAGGCAPSEPGMRSPGRRWRASGVWRRLVDSHRQPDGHRARRPLRRALLGVCEPKSVGLAGLFARPPRADARAVAGAAPPPFKLPVPPTLAKPCLRPQGPLLALALVGAGTKLCAAGTLWEGSLVWFSVALGGLSVMTPLVAGLAALVPHWTCTSSQASVVSRAAIVTAVCNAAHWCLCCWALAAGIGSSPCSGPLVVVSAAHLPRRPPRCRAPATPTFHTHAARPAQRLHERCAPHHALARLSSSRSTPRSPRGSAFCRSPWRWAGEWHSSSSGGAAAAAAAHGCASVSCQRRVGDKT